MDLIEEYVDDKAHVKKRSRLKKRRLNLRLSCILFRLYTGHHFADYNLPVRMLARHLILSLPVPRRFAISLPCHPLSMHGIISSWGCVCLELLPKSIC